MIKFRCKNCGEVLEAPQSLAGQMLNCPTCNFLASVPDRLSGKRTSPKAEKPSAPKIDLPKDLSRRTGKAAGNLLIAFWKNTPSAFRTSFLATLGVVAALTFALLTYRVPDIFRSFESEQPAYTQSQNTPPPTLPPNPPPIMSSPHKVSDTAVQDVPHQELVVLLKLREFCQALELIQGVRATAIKRYSDHKSFLNVLYCSSESLKDLYQKVHRLRVPPDAGLNQVYNDVLNAIDAEYALQQSAIEYQKKPSGLRREADIEDKAKKVVELHDRAVLSVIATLFERYQKLSNTFVYVENCPLESN